MGPRGPQMKRDAIVDPDAPELHVLEGRRDGGGRRYGEVRDRDGVSACRQRRFRSY